MRLFAVAGLLALVFLGGCVTPKPVDCDPVPGPSRTTAVLPRAPAPAPIEGRKAASVPKRMTTTTPPPAIVTPDASLTGKVARYNETGRFVVLEFPIAHLPGLGQRLFVYRDGLKIGEVRVTGPQRDDHTVADLTAGEAQPGDEVRDK